MINKLEILNSINREIVKAFPDTNVYRDACPKDFERPCFFIKTGKRTTRDINISTISVRQEFIVQCIDEVDEHYEASTDRLLLCSSTIENIFAKGYIKVLDRAIKVLSVNGIRDGEVSNVDIVLDYYDDRGILEEDETLVSEVKMNLKEE